MSEAQNDAEGGPVLSFPDHVETSGCDDAERAVVSRGYGPLADNSAAARVAPPNGTHQ